MNFVTILSVVEVIYEMSRTELVIQSETRYRTDSESQVIGSRRYHNLML